jgi:hypothetical protein
MAPAGGMLKTTGIAGKNNIRLLAGKFRGNILKLEMEILQCDGSFRIARR